MQPDKDLSEPEGLEGLLPPHTHTAQWHVGRVCVCVLSGNASVEAH